jgi:hypothetical protein
MSNPVHVYLDGKFQLIELDDMEVTDTIEVLNNCRKVTTTYRYNGVIVKQDVAASMLRGPDGPQSVQGKLNG